MLDNIPFHWKIIMLIGLVAVVFLIYKGLSSYLKLTGHKEQYEEKKLKADLKELRMHR